MTATTTNWPGTALRLVADWLSRIADRLERPMARALVLETSPLAPTAEDRLAEIRTRAHIPYY